MHPNIKAGLDRATELLSTLEAEYNSCLRSRAVTARAQQLTHEIVERLRSALDRTARIYWEQRVSPSLSEEDKGRATVYFPIAKDEQTFDSILGRWAWRDVRTEHQPVRAFLLGRQPFSSSQNAWLLTLADLANAGKHIDLVPQKTVTSRRTTVASRGGSVSWTSGVTFSGNVFVNGARIDPATQRIVPTPGVTETVEEWVSFVLAGHGVNALGFCKDSITKTRNLIEAMTTQFGLA